MEASLSSARVDRAQIAGLPLTGHLAWARDASHTAWICSCAVPGVTNREVSFHAKEGDPKLLHCSHPQKVRRGLVAQGETLLKSLHSHP